MLDFLKHLGASRYSARLVALDFAGSSSRSHHFVIAKQLPGNREKSYRQAYDGK